MQVRLIVSDEHRSGQVIPVNVPSFMIGRAEGCNLRSRSPQVSRFHCSITVNNDAVIVQDLGGENGTFVNGNRVSSVQMLNDGDKLVVGTHSFVVSIKPGVVKVVSGGQEANQDDFFELTASSALQSSAEQSDPTRATISDKTAMINNAGQPAKEAEIMFEIRLDGQRVSVAKSRLFDLARRGFVLPDDLIVVAGTKVFADSIQGIVFGDKSSPVPPPPPPPAPASTGSASTGSAGQALTAPAPQPSPVTETDPFAFADGETSPFDNITSEPFVRVVRKESAFGAIWSALDISFSRVYTIEGNNLVIHSLKALYYIVVLISLLIIFFMWLDVGRKCYEAGENALSMFLDHFVGLAFVTFGCVMIIVVVRILLEMFLLAWIESARADREKGDDE